jgi:hypothetical protein
VPTPVELSPEALHPRMTRGAGAFRRELLQRALAQLPTGTTVGDGELFTSFTAVPMADRPGFAVPPSRKALLPGRGGGASAAGAKMQLVGE